MVTLFIEENCKVGVNFLRAAALCLEWKQWAEQNNAFVGSSGTFGGWLEDRGFKRDKKDHGQRVFTGLRLITAEEVAKPLGGTVRKQKGLYY